MHVSSLLSLLNSCSLDPVGDYKAVEHISKNDVLGMYALFLCKTHLLLYQVDVYGITVLPKLSTERAFFPLGSNGHFETSQVMVFFCEQT